MSELYALNFPQLLGRAILWCYRNGWSVEYDAARCWYHFIQPGQTGQP